MSVNYLEQPKKANNSCKGGKKVVAKKKQKTPRIRRGEIYFANLNPVVGSEQGEPFPDNRTPFRVLYSLFLKFAR
jgi:hypothetical protein